MGTAFEFFFDVICRQDFGDDPVDVESRGVMTRIGLVAFGQDASFDVELVVVERPSVGRDPEVVPHIDGPEPFFAGHERLVELLAVSGADDARFGLAEEFHHALGEVADRRGVRLLDKEVAGLRMLERERDEIDRLVEVHEEPRHIRVRYGNGRFAFDLVDKERDDASATAHDVAVTRAAERRSGAFEGDLRPRADDLFGDRFRHAHRVDRVRRLVGREEDDAFDLILDRRRDDVVGPDHVRANGLHREELAGWDLFERRGVKDVVRAEHRVADGVDVSDVPDEELHLARVTRILRLENMAHPILLLLVAGEDTDLADLGGQKSFEHGRAKAARPARNDQRFAFKRFCDLHVSRSFGSRRP